MPIDDIGLVFVNEYEKTAKLPVIAIHRRSSPFVAVRCRSSPQIFSLTGPLRSSHCAVELNFEFIFSISVGFI